MNLIHDPFEQSFFALAHLSYMQAFEDVNKRTARLVANIPLIKTNLNSKAVDETFTETVLKNGTVTMMDVMTVKITHDPI
ncbi:MAG: hypothetical protein A2X86_22055 [Bdellovibrionales bacterium GWA2_49_15]|nr:MAG: hypothetical protein A2X86_22055 [Bdellovibrionales bacterium GWA2_49_15]